MEFTTLTPSEYEQWLQNLNRSNHLQTTDMARLKEERGATTYYVGVKDTADQVLEAGLVSSLPTKIGASFELEGWLPSNPVAHDSITVFLQGLQQFVKDHKGIQLMVKPDLPYVIGDAHADKFEEKNRDFPPLLEELGFDHSDTDTRSQLEGQEWTYKKDLRDVDPKKISKSYLKRGERSVKKGKSYPTIVREMKGLEELPRFYACYEETCQRLGIFAKDKEYFEQVLKTMPETSRFIMAEINFQEAKTQLEAEIQELDHEIEKVDRKIEKNPDSKKQHNQKDQLMNQRRAQVDRLDQVVGWAEDFGAEPTLLACAFFLYSPHELTYVFSGDYDQYTILNAPYLIQDRMIHEAVQNDIPTYDFLGLTQPLDENNGLLFFKSSFNGYVERNMGVFNWSPRPRLWKLYNQAKKIFL